MIPKIIHYCWLSNDPVPQKLQDYMSTWKELMPDYEFVKWDFSRFNKEASVWVKEAFDNKKYAFAADCIRMYALYSMGGIYLDMDVEVLKPFDNLLDNDYFVCCESDSSNPEVATFGAAKGCDWVKKMLDYYDDRHFVRQDGTLDTMNLPQVTKKHLEALGYQFETVKNIDDFRANIASQSENDKKLFLLPSEYFSPKSYVTGKLHTTKNTYSIHRFAGTWKPWVQRMERKFWRALGLKQYCFTEVIADWIHKVFKFHLLLALAFACLLAGCENEDYMTEIERTSTRFEEEMGHPVNKNQMWRTAVTLQVNVVTNSPVKIWLQTGEEDGILYDYAELPSSGSVMMTVPQGQANKFYLCYVHNRKYRTNKIELSGKTIETVDLTLTHSDSKSTAAGLKGDKGQTSNSLYPEPLAKGRPASLVGNSIVGNSTYDILTSAEMNSFYQMMDTSQNNHLGISNFKVENDYELVSCGPFNLTFIAGWNASKKSHIVGYYYHSPGTYDDIVYVDVCETHKWDYIDGLAKVQYRIGETRTTSGITFYPGLWYDANFDARDFVGSTYSENMDRIGDSAFNITSIYNRFRHNLVGLRGITFTVDVPVGKHIGLYLRSDEENYPEQWSRVRSKGVPPYVGNAALFKGTNFSAATLNLDGGHRSVIWDDGNAYWMGMEDMVEGGDHDCDDVLFCIDEELGVYKPEIISPDVLLYGTYDSSITWTLAFEDLYRNADFDFNDVVLRLIPDYKNELCNVQLMAVGTSYPMYLYYDGPEGEVCLGELHSLFGNSTNLSPINTTESMASSSLVEIDRVPWPKEYSMHEDAKRFKVRIKRGSCTDCIDELSLPDDGGTVPEALLVVGKWKWPLENISINTTYPLFRKWSQDVTRMTYWNWYKTPQEGRYVSY